MRYLLFLFLVHSIQAQCLDVHLYTGPQRQTIIANHVDSFSKIHDTIFYRKSNKLYAYSTSAAESYFIDWNVGRFTLAPDETMAYKKGNSFYLRAAPYSGKSRHVTWNVSSYFWTADSTLVYKKLNSHFILHNKFKDKPRIVSTNIERWIKGCYGELAYIKLGNLYYIDNKAKGSSICVQVNIQKAFFVNGSLYFIKNGDLWYYSSKTNIKKKLIYGINAHYICGDFIYVNARRGLHVVSSGNAVYTGHRGISKVHHSFRGISYIYKNRLYFANGQNIIQLCQNPGWYTFSESGCLYILHNNSLCFLDETFKVKVILEGVCSPLYKERRIYFTQKSRRYYLDPALGKVSFCQ